MCSALLDDNALIANGLNGKLEIVRLQRQHVGFLRPSAPGVDTTQAHLALLNMMNLFFIIKISVTKIHKKI